MLMRYEVCWDLVSAAVADLRSRLEELEVKAKGNTGSTPAADWHCFFVKTFPISHNVSIATNEHHQAAVTRWRHSLCLVADMFK